MDQLKQIIFLFIASGAFQLAKPSDLLARITRTDLPIRVELSALNEEDFKRILKRTR